jgi:hypothetical protein
MKQFTPKNWYIEVTRKNFETLDTWRKLVAKSHINLSLIEGNFVLSKHWFDDSYFFNSDEKSLTKHHPGYIKIDLETFLQITQPTKPQRFGCSLQQTFAWLN